MNKNLKKDQLSWSFFKFFSKINKQNLNQIVLNSEEQKNIFLHGKKRVRRNFLAYNP